MPSVIREGEQYKSVIPVDLAPTSHSVPSCRGDLLGKYADIYHFGAEVSSYELSDTDKIIIIASHKKPNPHILLLSHDAELIHKMPGKKDCSLVAKTINRVQLYITHSEHYPSPLTDWQIKKRDIAIKLLGQLKSLYSKERQLKPDDFEGREQLRNQIISYVERASDENYRLANHPFVSLGELGKTLYDSRRQAENYEFNPFKYTTIADQELFPEDDNLCYVWDSVAHISGTSYSIDDCLQTIASHYQLKRSASPKHPNRFMNLKQTIEKYHREANDYADYKILPKKPEQTSRDEFSKQVYKTFVDPYYLFQSPQADNLINTISEKDVYTLKTEQTASQFFQQNSTHNACFSPDKSLIYVKLLDFDDSPEIVSYRYYISEDKIHLLPTIDDLSAVTRASQRHLYIPERAWIHFKLFFNHIPAWINWLCRQTKRIALEEVYDHLVEQVHRGHKHVVHTRMHEHGLTHITKEIEKNLPDGMNFNDWLSQYLKENKYVFTTPAQPSIPSLYINPLHRVFNIADHAASFFVGMNERNPALGTVALSAYLFGGLSILASSSLESILEYLHLHGLTYLIPFAKAIGETMSRGPITQTISASMTLWQLSMITGQLDRASLVALSTIKENPAELIIVTTLALGLGYVLCNTIPYLKKEMGDFPYTNYAAVGAKGGAALYDTVVHPGDDWLLGTIKWVLTGVRLIGSLLVAPFIEGFYYGWQDGFINGLIKSRDDLKYAFKQIIAAIADVFLSTCIFILKYATALFLHVPFRGITSVLSNLIALIGHLKDLGNSLISFSKNQFNPMSSFRLSPFYGFNLSFEEDNDRSNSIFNIIKKTTLQILYTPCFILKDFVVLPLTDFTSYAIRFCLAATNHLLKAVSVVSGYVLLAMSMVIDPTIGWLCLNIADGITVCANFIDEQAGQLKRQALSQAQIQRGQLYRWAFANEESKIQSDKNKCSPSCKDPFIIDYLEPTMPISANI